MNEDQFVNKEEGTEPFLESGQNPTPELEADAPGDPELRNRADGVRGHYCIGRLMRRNAPYFEFWNYGVWCSAGQVFTDERLARAVLALTRSTTPTNQATSEYASLLGQLATTGENYMLTGEELIRERKISESLHRQLVEAEERIEELMEGYADKARAVLLEQPSINKVASPPTENFESAHVPDPSSSASAAKVAIEKDVELIASAITNAAKSIEITAAKSGGACPTRGTLEMIIRDFVVVPLTVSALPPVEMEADHAFESWWESQGLDGEQVRASQIDRWSLANAAFSAGRLELERLKVAVRAFFEIDPALDAGAWCKASDELIALASPQPSATAVGEEAGSLVNER